MRYTINPVYTLHNYFTFIHIAFNCSYIHYFHSIFMNMKCWLLGAFDANLFCL